MTTKTADAILVVDHDAGYRRLFRLLAEQVGVAACDAGTAEEAWGILVEGRCSMMALNTGLPDGNGETLAVMAKKLLPCLEVVSIADQAPSAHATSPGAPGVHEAIAKPFTIEELRMMIAALSAEDAPAVAGDGAASSLADCVGFGG